jgi:hypothetical protein
MSRSCNSDWVTPTLSGVHDPLAQDGMQQRAEIVVAAIAAVQRDGRASKTGREDGPLVSAPVFEGNIVRFNVASRHRKTG